MIEVLSSNRNRATATVRSLLTKYNGKLGESGSVNWLFDHRGVIVLSLNGKDKQSIELKAIDAGAQDIVEEEDGLTIYTKPEELEKTKKQLEDAGLKIDYAETEMIPKNNTALADQDKTNFLKLQEALENEDEVNAFYSNADI